MPNKEVDISEIHFYNIVKMSITDVKLSDFRPSSSNEERHQQEINTAEASKKIISFLHEKENCIFLT
jgi:hypothetical protein